MQFQGHCSETNVGLQRTNNEDCFLSSAPLGLWLVADGMGGHAAGEVASDIAAKTTRHYLQKGHSLADAIQAAHLAILDAAENGIGGQGMGSTIVALHSKKNYFEIAWVGDSRAYLYNCASAPKLTQITRDHSYVQFLFESGVISEAEMDNHPEKNIITQCLGSLDMERVRVDYLQRGWQPNDIILLCSDGLTDRVSDVQITAILNSTENLEQAAHSLVEAALAAGGHDNITIQLIERPNYLLRSLQAVIRQINNIIP